MELTQLKNKRESVYTRVEAILHVAQQVKIDAVVDLDRLNRFEVRFEALNELVNLFDSLHLDIVSVVDRSELESEHEMQNKFDELQYSIKTIYRELRGYANKAAENQARSVFHGSSKSSRASSKSRCSVKSSNARSLSEKEVTNANAIMSTSNLNRHLRLPKIEMPKFDGNWKNWPTFYDLFKTMIHENESLSDIEKFQYLSASLVKDAAGLIKNLPLTGSNYGIAFKSLVSRYHNTRVLLTNYWQGIVQAPKANSESASSLRTLLSVFSENLEALKQFEHDMWDFTKFNMLLQKVDMSLKQKFELEFCESDIPSFSSLCRFLEKQCKAMETTALTSNYVTNRRQHVSATTARPASSFVTSTKLVCAYCKEEHPMLKCDGFLSLSSHKRYTFAKKNNLCFNCLSNSHASRECKSSSCRVCNKHHHTLLHFPKAPASGDESDSNKPPVEEPQGAEQLRVLASVVKREQSVLLATIMLLVRDKNGKVRRCRALLDCASEANFISQQCVEKLGLNTSSRSVMVQGLNQMSSLASQGTLKCRVESIYEPTKLELDMIVIPNICSKIPSAKIEQCHWQHIQNLELADSEFGIPGDIEILLGTDVYAHVVRPGIKRGPRGAPVAINTVFGWVLMGSVEQSKSHSVVNSLCTLVDLDHTLKQFWSLEQVPQGLVMSPEDKKCEEIFKKTQHRNSAGRYILNMPFREGTPCLGESFSVALRRFYSLEARLSRDPALHKSYSEFIRDYYESGHMSLVSDVAVEPSDAYYIPHHCVLRPHSLSTKLRVVFDASSKSTNGVSLNDTLLVGAKLQTDIATVLLKFRSNKIAFTADIRQMYRQILVVDNHRDYQRILWRFSKGEPVQKYRLNTVTYGVSSSPHMAIRTMMQLCDDEESSFPLAAKLVRSDLYVDDVVSGVDSLSEAFELQRQLIGLFAKGGFELKKWASNNSKLLSTVSADSQQPRSLDLNDPSVLKILGLQWCPIGDTFSFNVEPIDRPCTKRNLLSELARIYDPLGFLSPVTLLAKYLMQCLWEQKVGWDDKPSKDIVGQWSQYKSQLSALAGLSIPRGVKHDNIISTELHGFCDASERGYAAVVYLRQVSEEGQVWINFLCAKSKVSPLKRISIPRLELCGCLLLAKLLEFVCRVYEGRFEFNSMYAWSDSMVALAWIKSSSNRWKTFIGNRVASIQEKIPPESWHHVSGQENPADCASRGMLPSGFCEHPLWWAGPAWLKLARENWPKSLRFEPPEECLAEQRTLPVLVTLANEEWLSKLLNRFSHLRKIQGVVVYCQRFVRNCRVSPSDRTTASLTATELQEALHMLIKCAQGEVFQREIASLVKGERCARAINKLAPFLDTEGILRVGGRLRQADVPVEVKHPILLPRSHRLTELIIAHTHHVNLHPGPRTLLHLLSQQFWILSPRRAIHHVLSRCYRCFRVNPTPMAPMMSDLPVARVSQLKPFSHSGVDFAGPVFVTQGRYRGVRKVKAYICLFVCMATKALHLEVVSDLSAEAFLAALRRFVARRGRCDNLYSDRGTNFVGSNKQLLNYAKGAADACTIKWHFNPPSAPHFGGLWEAGVRSVKTHLRRVIGLQILTFEEMSTLLAQVESVLNSRPLCSASTDPNDLLALSPGHFLTMEPLGAPPDADLTLLSMNRLSRWQLVQRIHQDFWRRWKNEYLHTLQQRGKWDTVQTSPPIGALVVIKDETSSPLVWKLGRIMQLYPGRDGIARVAQVRTSSGTFDRPLTKLCLLPSQ